MTREPLTVTADTLDAAVDWDCPFEVLADGRILPRVPEVYAPDVCLTGDADGSVLETDADMTAELARQGWAPVTGYSGQDRYSGPVMHASESLGGGMARDVLAAPGVYVLTAAEVLEDDGELSDTPAGWLLLRRIR